MPVLFGVFFTSNLAKLNFLILLLPVAGCTCTTAAQPSVALQWASVSSAIPTPHRSTFILKIYYTCKYLLKNACEFSNFFVTGHLLCCLRGDKRSLCGPYQVLQFTVAHIYITHYLKIQLIFCNFSLCFSVVLVDLLGLDRQTHHLEDYYFNI